jgi:steroid delta-isomerase-like uncharacterized protein
MPASTTVTSPQQLINTAKAPMLAYNAKDWKAARSAITDDFIYDEVGTRRKVQGADQALSLWKDWAAAFPDSKASFDNALVSGETVVLEVTWRGTHTGPLQTPRGPLAPTGRRIELRGCMVLEVAGDRVRAQRQYFDMATMMEQLGQTT